MDLTKDYTFDMDKGLIIREYRQAKDKNEQIKILAELNGVHPEVITSFLMSEGVITGAVKKKQRKSPFKWDADADAEVSRLSKEGFSLKEIAERLGVTPQSIYDRRRRLSMAVTASEVKAAKAVKADTGKTDYKERSNMKAGSVSVFEEIIKMLCSVGLEVSECKIDLLNKSFIIQGHEVLHGD